MRRDGDESVCRSVQKSSSRRMSKSLVEIFPAVSSGDGEGTRLLTGLSQVFVHVQVAGEIKRLIRRSGIRTRSKQTGFLQWRGALVKSPPALCSREYNVNKGLLGVLTGGH